MKVHVHGWLMVVAASFVLAACEGVLPEKEQPPVEDRAAPGTRPGADTGSPGRDTTRAVPEPSRGFQGHPLDDPDSLLAKRVVYFDFDSSEVHEEDRPIIEAHAQFLAENRTASVSLEGHADERGSREYNIGLGERRSQAVRRLLTLLGASDAQVRTVSYGEERPVDPGHDEAAWARNRRVEFNYISR